MWLGPFKRGRSTLSATRRREQQTRNACGSVWRAPRLQSFCKAWSMNGQTRGFARSFSLMPRARTRCAMAFGSSDRRRSRSKLHPILSSAERVLLFVLVHQRAKVLLEGDGPPRFVDRTCFLTLCYHGGFNSDAQDQVRPCIGERVVSGARDTCPS